MALLVYMPLHVFVSQWLSLATGGLEYWKVAKDVVLAVATVFAICLVFWQRKAEQWYMVLLGITGAYVLMHLIVWMATGGLHTESAALGLAYNTRLACFVVLGASAALVYPRVFALRTVLTIIIGVSTLVALFGIAQHFLPKDFLTHFGYAVERGVRPAFFIDDNLAFPRSMSTLRDPNSLGAYLIVPVTALTLLLLRRKSGIRWRHTAIIGLWLVHLAALYLTFSRSAWLGAFVALFLVVWWQFSSQFVRLMRKYWMVAVAAIVIIGGSVYLLRHQPLVDGVLTHSTEAQVGEFDSNDYHWLYVQRGIEGVIERPLGHGPGTAGIVSIRNVSGGLLTENYYVQIGYEVGVIGLAVFAGLQIWLYVRLWRRCDCWAFLLIATFWAYVVTNMFLHTWSNEAVAAQWWLLAGIALAVSRASLPRTTSHPPQ